MTEIVTNLKDDKCPICHKKMAKVVYGLPSSDKAKSKRYYYVGCVVNDDEEQLTYHCYHCDKSFYKDLSEEETKEPAYDYDSIKDADKRLISKMTGRKY